MDHESFGGNKGVLICETGCRFTLKGYGDYLNIKKDSYNFQNDSAVIESRD